MIFGLTDAERRRRKSDKAFRRRQAFLRKHDTVSFVFLKKLVDGRWAFCEVVRHVYVGDRFVCTQIKKD